MRLWLKAAKKNSDQALSLKANFSWTLVGNVIYAASQWGLVIIVAKFGDPALVGQFALAMALTSPIVIFSNLQLRTVQVTDQLDSYRFVEYLGLRIVTTVIALMAIIIVALFGDYSAETSMVILFVGLAKCFEAISDIYYGLQQQRERMDRIAKSLIIRGISSVVVMFFAMWLTGSVIVGTGLMALLWFILLITYDRMSTKFLIFAENQSKFARKVNIYKVMNQYWSLILLSLPLGIVASLTSLNLNVPRYFIESSLGESELGVFSALAYLMVVQATVVAALGHATLPRMSAYAHDRNLSQFTRILMIDLGIAVGLGVAGFVVSLLFGRDLISFFYQPEYVDFIDVFLILMFASIISNLASVFNFAMLALRYYKVQLPLFLFVLLVVIGTSFYFIPTYGLIGAALTRVSSLVFQLAGSGIVVFYGIRKISKESKSML
ncbi:oligosaccharide flippase family protein [Phototrophicus methaneseepsis]|uniref:Oligosaccharide flippase family protein n=1 Tax=Phototrophicus methaneseepsis TaxID=2710758 RepID=A0A7S8E7X9_9CHLR|nr:oligosaccharide flippase family protein [Phototrophicus methaneseepsis]QPC82038.1 oligosaccharide flippase family protein [Phototrophicus methaneseepsis]